MWYHLKIIFLFVTNWRLSPLSVLGDRGCPPFYMPVGTHGVNACMSERANGSPNTCSWWETEFIPTQVIEEERHCRKHVSFIQQSTWHWYDPVGALVGHNSLPVTADNNLLPRLKTHLKLLSQTNTHTTIRYFYVHSTNWWPTQ